MPVALHVMTKQGVEFIASLSQATSGDEAVLSLAPAHLNSSMHIDSGNIEAAIGVWVFLHEFREEWMNRVCDLSSFDGQSHCTVRSMQLQLSYDAVRRAFTASFVADWTLKYYKISVEVMLIATLIVRQPWNF